MVQQVERFRRLGKGDKYLIISAVATASIGAGLIPYSNGNQILGVAIGGFGLLWLTMTVLLGYSVLLVMIGRRVSKFLKTLRGGE